MAAVSLWPSLAVGLLNTYQKLYDQLGYTFKKPRLLSQALTHRSGDADSYYERLEFLGDSVLSLCVSTFLYQRFPEAQEGALSTLRAQIVCKTNLAVIARQCALSTYIRIGEHEKKQGSHQLDNVLSDVLEAIIGAIYLDCDQSLTVCAPLITRLLDLERWQIPESTSHLNAKSELQELLQKHGIETATYHLKDHHLDSLQQHVFSSVCRLKKLGVEAEGWGSTKRQSEQQAAEHMLQQLRERNLP